jgi:hypothetical protein
VLWFGEPILHCKSEPNQNNFFKSEQFYLLISQNLFAQENKKAKIDNNFFDRTKVVIIYIILHLFIDFI